MITDSSEKLNDKFIKYLVEKIYSKLPNDLIEEDIKFVFNLMKQHSGSHDEKDQSLLYFWKIIVGNHELYSARIKIITQDKFCETLESGEQVEKIKSYIKDSIENIQKGVAVASCLTIIQKIIEHLPEKETKTKTFTKYNCIEYLLTDIKIVSIIQQNIIAKKKKLSAEISTFNQAITFTTLNQRLEPENTTYLQLL